MKNLYMILIVFLNVIFQVTLYSFLNIFGVIPNISLILIVLFSLNTNEIMGGFIGFFTGIVYDLLIMDIIGINTLIYFIVGIFLGHFSNEINRENDFLYLLVTVVATVFYHLCVGVIMFFLRMDITKIVLILDKILIQIVLNAIFCILLEKFLDYLFGLFNIKLFSNK